MYLVPTTKQWKLWSLPAKLTAIGTLVGIISFACYITEKSLGILDHFSRKASPPKVTYGLLSYPERIALGTDISGVIWQSEFSRHSFTIQNDSTETPLTDVRIKLTLPAGVVLYKLQANEGCQDAVLSQYNIDGGIGNSGVIHKAIQYYMNNLTASVARMSARSRLTIFLVVAYRGGGDDPFWCDIEYSYSDGNKNHWRTYRHPIKIITDNPFTMQIDQATNMANKVVKSTVRVMPAKPIAFGPNGTTELHYDLEIPSRK